MSRCVADDRGCQCVLLGVLKLIATGQASYNTKHRKGPILKNLKTKSTIVHRAGSAIGASTTSSGHLSPARLRVVQNSCLTDRYEISEDIVGEGATGAVKLVTEKHRRQTRALKTLHLKDAEDANHVDEVLNEMEVYLRLDHPNICRLLEVNVEEGKCHLIMEHCLGRELFDRLEDTGPYSELDATLAVSQMLDALQYLHSRHICHRDLKLENILYDSRSSSVVKVIDFGFAMFCRDGEGMMAQNAGTIGYLAPEVVSSATGTCGFSCDMWSVGVIAYVLLSGEMPFGSSSEKNVLKRIRTGAFSFPSERWGSISDIGLDFVRRCLSMRPQDRPSATDALRHPWLTFPKVPARCAEIAGAASPQGLLLGASTATSLSRFALMPVARLACLRLAAVSLMGSWLKPTRRDFLRLDETGSEYAFLEGLRSALESSLPEEEVMTICETLATSHENDVSSNVPGFKYSDFLVAADISEAADAGDHVFKDAFRRFDKESSDLVDGESVLKILHGDAEPEIEDVLDEACKPARTTGCYWVDRRWHAVLLLPFLFSLAATSNLTWPQ
mmetsp:Transcript_104112/g.301179  ORF Transcript_104112/g.301179 Transcript_104112/m.301179 type:complete len:559 (+) Transcript_104112:94-1770(+)